MGGYPSVLVGSVSVCHFKLMNRLTHGPGCVKTPTIWAFICAGPGIIFNCAGPGIIGVSKYFQYDENESKEDPAILMRKIK